MCPSKCNTNKIRANTKIPWQSFRSIGGLEKKLTAGTIALYKLFHEIVFLWKNIILGWFKKKINFFFFVNYTNRSNKAAQRWNFKNCLSSPDIICFAVRTSNKWANSTNKYSLTSRITKVILIKLPRYYSDKNVNAKKIV